VQPDDALPSQALRPRGPDVVLLERLEHRPAHEPCEVRHRGEPERDRGEHLGLPRGPPGRREAEIPLEREEVDRERRDQEAGHGEADVREEHRPVVERRVGPERGDHPQGDAEQHREQECEPAQLERDREMGSDDVVDGPVAEHERRAEVEREHALGVEGVLHVPGLVQVELPLEVSLDRLGDVPLAGAERVALDLPHQDERQEDDEQDDGDRPDQPPNDERHQRARHSRPLSRSECFTTREDRTGRRSAPSESSLSRAATRAPRPWSGRSGSGG
jgi:hypothetical protein